MKSIRVGRLFIAAMWVKDDSLWYTTDRGDRLTQQFGFFKYNDGKNPTLRHFIVGKLLLGLIWTPKGYFE